MTESSMESRAVPTAAPTKGSAGQASKTTLNPSAKSFVFSASAPVWTPTKAVTAPVAAAPVPVLAPVPVSASVPAPVAVAPTTPIKSSSLKVTAKAFVPSVFAAPFVPTFAAAPPPPPPPASPQKPSPPVVAEEETAPVVASLVEPESEELSQHTAVTDKQEQEEEEQVIADDEAHEEVELVAEEEDVAEEEEVAKTVTETQTTTKVDAVEQETHAVGERIMYTIAQLLEMEPENCPIPPSVMGTQVVSGGKNGNDGEAAEAHSKSGGLASMRGGKEPRGGSSRSLGRSNSGFDGGRGGRGRGGRGSGRGGRGGHSQYSQPEIALEDVVPLQINEETRWKPTHAKSRLDDQVDTTESSLKEAKAILNKLSIEKFDKLSDQLIEVAVRSIDVLSGVIEMVIAKAQMEWHFSTMYASLCSKIAHTEMPAMALDENEVAQDTHKLFRKLLLTRCQKEFEVTPSKDGWDELPDDERAEKELLLKRATLGHIRFVGELFKQRMLSSRIMHACVQRLFGDIEQPDEESLECLCNLLATIGQKLEGDARDQGELTLIGQYYGGIKKLASDSAKLCTRVRFMLQDLLDLRKNKWVARRKEAKAMTIAEVHAEAAREAKEKAKASAAGVPTSGSTRSLQRTQSNASNTSDKRRSSKDSGGSGGASAAWKARAAATSVASSSSSGPTVDADGWETAGSGSRPSKLLLKSRSSVLSNSSERVAPPRHPALGRTNSFSMLRQESGRGYKDSGARERSFSSSATQSRRNDHGNGHRAGNGSVDRPPRHDVAALPQTKSDTEGTEEDDDDEVVEVAALSRDAFKKKVKAILEEFVELQDLDEAVSCVNELHSRAHHALIISHSMDIGLEKGAKQRQAVGALLAGLYERELLDHEAFALAVHEHLECAEDMEIDIPLTLNYLAEMLAPSVAVGAVQADKLANSVAHMAETGKAAKFVALLLNAIQDEAKAKAFVRKLDVTELLREGERTREALHKLYETHQLEFLLV